MSKKILPLVFLSILLISIGIFSTARADVGPKNGDTWVPATAGPAPVDKDPLTVADLLIDKTAANSVAARDQAIADAPMLAFQKLAERNLPEKQAKALKVPKNVASLVQDFEIKGEQMSSTRYVAKFTVRFSDSVRQYIDVHETPVAAAGTAGQPATAATAPEDTPENTSEDAQDEAVVGEEPAPPVDAQAAAPADAQAAAPADGRVVWNDNTNRTDTTSAGGEGLGKIALVLPYLENMSGQTVLWEDPNPWRRIWQNALPNANLNGTQLVVPLGDVSDLASGPSNAVWSGDYGAVEKLRRNYGADDVILLAANKSGSSMTVDVYTYRDGRFRHRGSLTPFVGDKSDVEAYRQALSDTLRYLAAGQLPQQRRPARPSLEMISHDATHAVNAHPSLVQSDTQPETPAPGTLILKPYSATPQPMQPSVPPVQQSRLMPPAYAPQPGVTQYAQTPVVNGRTQLAAMATFRNFQSWMEMQKRLNGMAPMVGIDIRSINSNSAAVTLNYASSLDALRGELATRGIALGGPAGMDPVQGPLYSLQLVN